MPMIAHVLVVLRAERGLERSGRPFDGKNADPMLLKRKGSHDALLMTLHIEAKIVDSCRRVDVFEDA